MIGRPAWTARDGSRRVGTGVRVTQGYPDRAAAGDGCRVASQLFFDVLFRGFALATSPTAPACARTWVSGARRSAPSRCLDGREGAHGEPSARDPEARGRPGRVRMPRHEEVDGLPPSRWGGPSFVMCRFSGASCGGLAANEGGRGGSSIPWILPGLLRHQPHEAGAERGCAHWQVAPCGPAGAVDGPERRLRCHRPEMHALVGASREPLASSLWYRSRRRRHA